MHLYSNISLQAKHHSPSLLWLPFLCLLLNFQPIFKKLHKHIRGGLRKAEKMHSTVISGPEAHQEMIYSLRCPFPNYPNVQVFCLGRNFSCPWT